MAEAAIETKMTLEAIDAWKVKAKAVREVQPAIPLADAVLCLTCEILYAGSVCPKCGDPYGWLVGRWFMAKNGEREAA